MGLLRRTPPPERRVTAFWDWWTREGARTSAAAIDALDPHRVAEEISRRVGAVDRRLAWEFAPGEVSDHLLVVTAEGDPALRALARQWLLHAPEPDGSWSFSDLRPPARAPEGIVLSAEDAPRIGFGQVSVAARRRGVRLDLVVHHPSFGELPPQARTRIAFLALDATLGEALVQCWVGTVETATEVPRDGLGLEALGAAVRELADEYVDADGHPAWLLLEAATDAVRGLASTVVPLDPLLAPHLTVHVGVVAEYAEQTDEGLPGPGSLDRLRALEDRLAQVLGGDGLLVAHETSAGRRVLHAYARSGAPLSARALSTALPWPEGRLRASVEDDPGWQAVGHLRA